MNEFVELTPLSAAREQLLAQVEPVDRTCRACRGRRTASEAIRRRCVPRQLP